MLKNSKLKTNSKLVNVAISISLVLFSIFVILFSVLSIIQSSHTYFNDGVHYVIYKGLFSIRSLFIFVLLVVLCILIKRYGNIISSKKLLIIEMIIFGILGIIHCLSYINISPRIDSLTLYENAKSMYFGDFSVLDSKTYIGENPQNLGMLTLYYLFVKIFANSIYVPTYLRLFNLIFSIVGYIYLYKITDILYHDNTVNLYLLLIIFGFNHLLLYSVNIYTNVLGYSLTIVSIYYLIYYLKYGKRIFLSFIFIVLSIIIRKNSLIILIAEIIVLLINTINKKKLNGLLFVVLFLMELFTSKLVIHYYESKYNVIYDHQLPNITYVCYGLNYKEDSPGRWVNDFTDIFHDSGYDKEVVKSYANIYIDTVLNYFKNNPLKCVKFYTEKFITGWCDHTYDVFTNKIYNEECVIKPFEKIMSDIYDAFLSLIAIGLLFSIKRVFRIENEYILVLSVVGGFIFHFFWEIQSIYIFQYILLLLPLSAKSTDLLFNNTKRYSANTK